MRSPRLRKSWKTNAIFLFALWVILLLASLTILSSVVTPFLRTLQTQTLVSLDWAGYAASSDDLFPRPLVTSVGASWVVPTVAITPGSTFSAVWVGVGGQSDTTLIQVGTEQDSSAGQPRYYAWYELLPNDSVRLDQITLSPGDQINASLTLIDSSTNQWQIQLQDFTTGQGFSQTFAYNSSRLTAEWVVERPTLNNQITTLADFGTVTFTNVTTQIGDTKGTAGTFPNYELVMEDRQNNQLVTISSLSKDGSTFTISYR